MNIENKKQVAVILLAVGLGLVAAILTGNHIQSAIQSETSALAQEYENEKIRPLVHEIQALRGEVKNLAQRQIAVAKQQQALSTQQPIKPAVPEVPKSSLALRTPPGKRAITILIDSLSAVGGLINPGDYVDIMGHLAVPAGPHSSQSAKDVTAIMFQNIQVLAVGTNLQATGGYDLQQQSGSLLLTLAVAPEEAGLLTFAQKNGRLQFVLRSPSETEVEMLQASNWETFAEYVFDKQGLEIETPQQRAIISPVAPGMSPAEEVQPYIQIFRDGREL